MNMNAYKETSHTQTRCMIITLYTWTALEMQTVEMPLVLSTNFILNYFFFTLILKIWTMMKHHITIHEEAPGQTVLQQSSKSPSGAEHLFSALHSFWGPTHPEWVIVEDKVMWPNAPSLLVRGVNDVKQEFLRRPLPVCCVRHFLSGKEKWFKQGTEVEHPGGCEESHSGVLRWNLHVFWSCPDSHTLFQH